MARKKAEAAAVEPEVTTEVEELEDDFVVDIPVSDEVSEEVSEEDEKDEEFFQMSDIGEDEDEVTDDEISEDM